MASWCALRSSAVVGLLRLDQSGRQQRLVGPVLVEGLEGPGGQLDAHGLPDLGDPDALGLDVGLELALDACT